MEVGDEGYRFYDYGLQPFLMNDLLVLRCTQSWLTTGQRHFKYKNVLSGTFHSLHSVRLKAVKNELVFNENSDNSSFITY